MHGVSQSHIHEPDREQVLVDLEDPRDNNKHREIALGVSAQVQTLNTVIVSRIPRIKFAIERIPLLPVFLLLKLEQRLTILPASWVKGFPQVMEKLGGELHVNGRIASLKEEIYRLNVNGIFSHIHFRYVVQPSGVSQKRCDLTA